MRPMCDADTDRPEPPTGYIIGCNLNPRLYWDLAVNIQQLRYLCAIVDHGLNVSDAAEALFTSQPGVSKQIRQLEDELGVPVFIRQGKRLASLTDAGAAVVETARRALKEIENLKRLGAEYRRDDAGTLSIATTHTQARYVLPPILRDFAE